MQRCCAGFSPISPIFYPLFMFLQFLGTVFHTMIPMTTRLHPFCFHSQFTLIWGRDIRSIRTHIDEVISSTPLTNRASKLLRIALVSPVAIVITLHTAVVTRRSAGHSTKLPTSLCHRYDTAAGPHNGPRTKQPLIPDSTSKEAPYWS